MEKDIPIGSAGGVKLSLAGGKAVVSIELKEAVLDGAISAQASASGVVDAGIFVDMLFAEIEAKSPAGVVVIEDTVKALIKSVVMAIQ